MRFRALIVMSAALAANAQPTAPTAPTEQQAAAEANTADPLKTVAPGVVALRAFDAEGNETARATGFFVANVGLIAPKSLLAGAASATMLDAAGNSIRVVGVTGEHPETDLVLLAVERLGDGMALLSPAVGFVSVGRPVTAVVPADGERAAPATVETRTVALKESADLGPVLTLDLALEPGMVGAPAVDREGKVVGIVSRTGGDSPVAALIPYIRVLEITVGMPRSIDERAGVIAKADQADAVEAAAAIANVKLEQRPDGTTLVDDRFAISGAGTRENPYVVPWEMLISASEIYNPRKGRNELPKRIQMLNDKFVRITGYTAFPVYAQQADELLVMLNQWDGCCIGVPPTPYDAIEVRLSEPATGKDRFVSFGTITGRLGVDPYLVGEWLVGLYIMDDAALTPTDFGNVLRHN